MFFRIWALLLSRLLQVLPFGICEVPAGSSVGVGWRLILEELVTVWLIAKITNSAVPRN